MSDISYKLNSHATKATVETVALQTAVSHPACSSKDRDTLQVHLVGVPTYTQIQDLKDLAFKLSKA